jgi:hypothetical protein
MDKILSRALLTKRVILLVVAGATLSASVVGLAVAAVTLDRVTGASGEVGIAVPDVSVAFSGTPGDVLPDNTARDTGLDVTATLNSANGYFAVAVSGSSVTNQGTPTGCGAVVPVFSLDTPATPTLTTTHTVANLFVAIDGQSGSVTEACAVSGAVVTVNISATPSS